MVDLTAESLQVIVGAGLRSTIADIELEQASHGLDSWRELELHRVLADAFVAAGCFVAREQRYPGDRSKKARTSGRRCDLVITTAGPLLLEDAQPELFSTPAVTSSSAAWLELKVLKQFRAGKANIGWQQALLAPPTVDLHKLADDPALGLRALVMVLFTASIEVSEHDFAVWLEVVTASGLVVVAQPMTHLPLVDRRGNRWCSVVVVVVVPRITRRS